ncbi:2-C-methyl-D-erythritol 4-phosphate cytidylyltransferase [Marinimicrobium alkaliphilum]|uniref:2-C-methyl-D-erythritol 4-phosphate cytidylyltransferase n=1 Tax=Marinimicrobium alkaliphilum TaxID=2202654 RepID=UPI000DB9756B|nr:2-C-methyl-D-erythritol 4-phosphate cytidylyltransferase [Marinimicrobium alkaliphilum]
MSLDPAKTWVLVPAAGVGVRMGANRPKQYLPLCDHTLLEQTLTRLLAASDIRALLLMLSAEDDYWHQLPLSHDSRIQTLIGGSERADSVLNGLRALEPYAGADDWVLVHDAARPCITPAQIEALRTAVVEHPVGGILGVPVSDTVKRVSAGEILATEDRRPLWRAQTPQIFRYRLLRDCLATALEQGLAITDEASAVEAFGHRPLMVEGREDNLKVTRPEDLPLAALILEQQEKTP